MHQMLLVNFNLIKFKNFIDKDFSIDFDFIKCILVIFLKFLKCFIKMTFRTNNELYVYVYFFKIINLNFNIKLNYKFFNINNK